MAATYTPATDAGRVRLLISDTGGAGEFLFQDEEINEFLGMNGGTVLLAAAQALRTIAGNEVQTSKVIQFLDLKTDGAKVAAALLAQADKLEAQADDDADFEIAELGVTQFQRHEMRDL